MKRGSALVADARDYRVPEIPLPLFRRQIRKAGVGLEVVSVVPMGQRRRPRACRRRDGIGLGICGQSPRHGNRGGQPTKEKSGGSVRFPQYRHLSNPPDANRPAESFHQAPLESSDLSRKGCRLPRSSRLHPEGLSRTESSIEARSVEHYALTLWRMMRRFRDIIPQICSTSGSPSVAGGPPRCGRPSSRAGLPSPPSNYGQTCPSRSGLPSA